MKSFTRAWLALIFVSLWFSGLLQAADTAGDFTVAGRQTDIHLRDYRGRVLLLDFWASWCGPCRQSFPWMQKMHTTYGEQGLKILAINVDADRALADKFLDMHFASFDIGFDPGGRIAEKWNLPGMPTSFLIDANGQILQRHVGFREKNKSEYENQIRNALESLNREEESAVSIPSPVKHPL